MYEDAASSSGTGRVMLLVGVAALVVLVVLRSPADVLGTIVPGAPASPQVDAETPVEMVGSVPAAVTAPGGTGSAGEAQAATTDVGRWGEPAPRPTTGVVVEELRGAWRVEPGIEEAVALAVVAAHRWGAGSVGEADARGGGAVIVTVEAVERPGAHHAVITLLVAVEADLHRIAQPVRLDTGAPSLAGPPWRLDPPELRVIELEGSPIGDTELIAAAERSLTHAGLPGERLTSLEATDGWPFIARLEDTDDVWLRWHVDRFVVPGLPLDAIGGG